MDISRNKRASLLLVEDEVLVRWATLAALRDAGFDVIDVERADDALAILETRDDIALVFTDINMPGEIDGLDLAFEVRRRWPGIGLLVTSGGSRSRPPRLPQGGRFLAKPYADVDLIAGVNALAVPNERTPANHSSRLQAREPDLASLGQARWVSR